MANAIKQAVFKLMDKAFTQEGLVLEIRKWQPAAMYEIDLYLPGTDMNKWSTIPRLKCKVAEFEYRDYTPASWDTEKRTCTMLIETGHDGYGSSWARQLKAGDTILFGPAHSSSLPVKTGKILCFGDGSALGFFLALKQMTNRPEHPIEIKIIMNEVYTLLGPFMTANPEVGFMMHPLADSFDMLRQIIEKAALDQYVSIYVAGYIPMVQGIRKLLKNIPHVEAKIFAHGFWS